MEQTEVDVVVVGAGFAGLAAARELHRRGRSVAVLEALDRVGGRARTHWLADGTQVDLGAQWIGPGQDAMYALVDELGLATFPSAADGAPAYVVDGRQLDALPAACAELLGRIDALAATLDPLAPWQAPDATRLDATTLATWLEAQDTGTDGERSLVGRMLAGGLQTHSAGSLSLLQLLTYVRRGQGVDSLLDMAGGAQQDRIVGGPGALAEAMAGDLPPGTVHLGRPVTSITWSPDHVLAATPAGEVTARRAVVAVPAPLVASLHLEPDLPPAARIARTSLVPGIGLKVHLVHERAWWHDRGLSGQVNLDSGWVTETVDNTVPGSPVAVLTAFLYGDDARAARRLAPAERQAAIGDQLAAVLGEQARHPLALVEHDWAAEPTIQGCFAAGFAPGSLVASGPDLDRPVGPIHWAGTEHALRWNGYLEGAVTSGRAAATAVAAELT